MRNSAGTRLDGGIGLRIEGGREIHQLAAGQQAQAGVQVKPRVRQPQRHHVHLVAQPRLQGGGGAGIAAVAVAEPQARCGAVEQRIAGAFEFDVQRGHVEIAFGEPAGEMRLFARAFGVAEMAGHGAAAVDQAGIGGEHHVRQAGHGVDQFHRGHVADQRVQSCHWRVAREASALPAGRPSTG
jgi:hypothetical protein